MTSSMTDDANPLERLIEEFLDRQRRGEHPTLTEYTARYPELAEEIRGNSRRTAAQPARRFRGCPGLSPQ
jgi:hypothetical protein